MDIEIIKLSSNTIDDFLHLIRVFEEVFEWEKFSPPGKPHLQRVLCNSNFLVFAAKTGNKIVGGLTAYVLDRYDTETPSAYIYDLAVSTALQRKGIGKLLIATFSDYCKRNGFNEIFVQAEAEDNRAISFYRSTNISNELQATHFTYSFHNERELS